jgi:hypothetical protein
MSMSAKEKDPQKPFEPKPLPMTDLPGDLNLGEGKKGKG